MNHALTTDLLINGGVWTDVSHLGAEFVERNFTGMRDRCLRLGYDPAREKVEVVVKKREHAGEPRPEQISAAQAGANEFLERKPGESPWPLRDELGRVMWERVGIVRHGDKLKRALEEIVELKRRLELVSTTGTRAFNLTWQQALDLRNMLTASELIARSALMREDSRGAHYREDFPNADDFNWLRNIYIASNGDAPKLWTEPVKLTRLKP